MTLPLEDRCKRLVEKLGLASAEDVVSVEPLSGGVSSDVAVIDLRTRKICVKFALPQLRVAADWYASVARNRAEYLWLEFAGQVVPGATPRLLGRDAELNGIAMEFISGQGAYLWKTALLERAPIRKEGKEVGDSLGRIHAASSRTDFDAGKFQNQRHFYDLRIEPYLEFTAGRHRRVAHRISQLIAGLQANSTVLIHGDMSPKNIVFREGRALFLDAECATMGDPCFDLAFCMNHLLLKSFHMPDRAPELLQQLGDLWCAYATHIEWESPSALERRVAQILPALMLARIDGKSPVEYLSTENQSRVREVAISLITQPASDFAEFADRIGPLIPA